MRIVKELERNGIKISIFKMDNKYSIKLERNLLEQIYKFRLDDRLQNVEEIEILIDSDFLTKAENIFLLLQENKLQTLERNYPITESEHFDKII
jgi:hypothetical protein